MPKRIPPVVWIVLLWWTAYALMFASQVVKMGEDQGNPVSWQEALHFSFGGWMTWVPLSLALYWLVRRHPVQRGQMLRSLLLLTAGVLLVVLLRAAYVYVTNPVFAWYGKQPLPGFGSVLATSLRNNFLLAWIVIGVAHALVFYQRSREREQKVAELEATLATSRLEALRAQLNPHFLFNALNSVAEMLHQDVELADRMLVALAALLRDSLASDEGQQRPLRDELALVQHYLTIERIRLGERLQIDWRIDMACMDVPVPALILQPLVENAIVHGIARRRLPGHLIVRGRLDGDLLVLEVENSVAPEHVAVPGIGIGLHSTRGRLHLLYGERAHLANRLQDAERYVVELAIPLPARWPRHAPAGEIATS